MMSFNNIKEHLQCEKLSLISNRALVFMKALFLSLRFECNNKILISKKRNKFHFSAEVKVNTSFSM